MTSRDYDAVTLGTDDPGEDVSIVKTTSGRALVVPVSMRRLGDDQADVVADLQAAAVEVTKAQELVDELVELARGVGCSWGVIGWSTGFSDRGAAARWGGSATDE